MTGVNKQLSVILDNIQALVANKMTAEKAILVQKFIKLLFKDTASDDLMHRSDSDLYGAAISLWKNFVRSEREKLPKVAVFNPDLAEHGWQSTHTIVEIVCHNHPFIVGSVRMALERLSVNSHWMLYQSFDYQTDDGGGLADFDVAGQLNDANSCTLLLLEIDHQSELEIRDKIKKELTTVLRQIEIIVDDWQALKDQCLQVADSVKSINNKKQQREAKDLYAFLKWMADNKFTFLGYRKYDIKAVEGDHIIERCKETGLGLLRKANGQNKRKLSQLPVSAQKEALSDNILVASKTNQKSHIHRPAYMEYLGVKIFSDDGDVIGEHRFMGLFASDFYNDSIFDIPLLCEKALRILASTDYVEGSHPYKALQNILESYPREELLYATEAQIRRIAFGILQMQERGSTRLFTRRDLFGKYFSCIAYVPRERYNTQLRKETQRLLQSYFGSDRYVEFNTYLSESPLARTHYTVRVDNNNVEIDEHELQNNMIELVRSWEDKLIRSLTHHFGEEKGKRLAALYESAFPRSYQEHELPNTALVDIEKLDTLSAEKPFEMMLYRGQEDENQSTEVRLKVYHREKPIYLSDILPILENFGLRVIDERPYRIQTTDGTTNWVLDFSMATIGGFTLDLKESRALFQRALADVWYNKLENDGFNRLVLEGGVIGRQVAVLRAYARYMRQTGLSFNQSYIENTFATYPQIAEQLVNLFEARFSPTDKLDTNKQNKLVEQIEAALDSVANLDDDRIIRRFVAMIQATLRTNFYQRGRDGQYKSYISLKLSPQDIPDMPKPVPKFEIYVYSPEVEGVHLRGGKVARGGLRWSDRKEDFRTEVLGLVKAQQVKNTVILPVGAKGGFVCKQPLKTDDRAAFIEQGKACYRTFIRALLDITDNIKQGEVVYPQDVVRYDDDDPYLVVAADKGTASFSDIANGISEEYDFWLKDAFASGGSVGYDHKKMGITARGAWESVKRHFRELGIDCQTTDFTCVAVGDMSGDVFGNGMLLSKHTRLLAAFNHLHIFIDPEPDIEKSYAERARLFAAGSGWGDYDKNVLSQDGAIFSRAAKSIKLNERMQKMLRTDKNNLPPNELIRLILKMPADLFWNGGIGTYIKSSKETHESVGDRANDSVRIDGKEVNFKIIGEGGNLGCTQLGRIEAATNGVRVNTDFIDNVGGVDCSDKEVNIKILLNSIVSDEQMTNKQRNKLLSEMTQEVAGIVLDDCYRQTLSLSVTEHKIESQMKEKLRFMNALEKQGLLDRELEFLPNEEALSERLSAGKGLTRPELCVLLAYAKMDLKERFNTSKVTSNAFIRRALVRYFPKPLQEGYDTAIKTHPLKCELIATEVANQVVNLMGMNFVFRMQDETGAEPHEIAIAFTIASHVFELENLWHEIEKWDNKVAAEAQLETLFQLRRTVRRATRWFLRNRANLPSVSKAINKYRPVFNELSENLTKYLPKDELGKLKDRAQTLVDAGVDKDFASRLSNISTLFSVMDIAEVADQNKRPLDLVAGIYYQLGGYMQLDWFLEQINNQNVTNHWQALARAAYREELDSQRKVLTQVVLKSCDKDCSAIELIEEWGDKNQHAIERWQHLLSDFKAGQNHEFAKFSVVLRELMLLARHCDTMLPS
ncbi:NAD-glutamate dehydrogenase [Gayadomonas joobiniege]|uniref:NAD-glutamate dehydrogenase n=1 Tax=Gayadomonas joobiniege TaxID=1234606 RepID=UPI0003652FFC|nr:NAD-glutamate dehydrogenase [Gayadomonas joobiniege]